MKISTLIFLSSFKIQRNWNISYLIISVKKDYKAYTDWLTFSLRRIFNKKGKQYLPVWSYEWRIGIRMNKEKEYYLWPNI